MRAGVRARMYALRTKNHLGEKFYFAVRRRVAKEERGKLRGRYSFFYIRDNSDDFGRWYASNVSEALAR